MGLFVTALRGGRADGRQPAARAGGRAARPRAALLLAGRSTSARRSSPPGRSRSARWPRWCTCSRSACRASAARPAGCSRCSPAPTRSTGWPTGVHAVGFPLWTFAALIAGPIWAEYAWGSYWNWDPKEVWAFITWVIYAAYLHARATAGWKGRAAAIIALDRLRHAAVQLRRDQLLLRRRAASTPTPGADPGPSLGRRRRSVRRVLAALAVEPAQEVLVVVGGDLARCRASRPRSPGPARPGAPRRSAARASGGPRRSPRRRATTTSSSLSTRASLGAPSSPGPAGRPGVASLGWRGEGVRPLHRGPAGDLRRPATRSSSGSSSSSPAGTPRRGSGRSSLAVLVSAVISAYALRGLRERFTARVHARADRMVADGRRE